MSFFSDLKFAPRSLWRAKGLSLTVAFTLALGIVAGAAGGFALAKIVGSYVTEVQLPGALPLIGSAVVLIAAAVLASVLPAARAARVDVMEALRSG